jgi:bifunctional enzyme CysN/CysC
MAHVSDMIGTDIGAYLKSHERKGMLRFITCGSVDDGKSTLLGRLLYDSKMIFDDQLSALDADSKRIGTQGQNLDFALLVDGLAAEREQGITIDVAYRFFSTDRRKFIAADTPGHEQYTRNMITGASTADVAIVLIDARKGILTQTRRHSYLVSLVGIRQIVLAVNKMDLMNYDRDLFDKIVADYMAFAAKLGIRNVTAIPMSALNGDNITKQSERMPWYRGPTLMGLLETVPVDHDRLRTLPMRFPVQWVNRPDQNFRGFAGTIASGELSVGDKVRVQPSGKEGEIARIVTRDGDLQKAIAGQAVTLTLTQEIDVSRGDILSAAQMPAEVADQFEAQLVWMSEDPLFPGRNYWLKIGRRTVNATVTRIKHQVNVNSMEHLAADKLDLNAVAVCNFSVDQPIAFDAYKDNPATGSFILIDRLSNNTVAAGMVEFALRRANNIQPQHFRIDKTTRAQLNNQKPCVLWLTGLSGSGKSTIANLVEQKLFALGHRTYVLDGDNLRHGLNRDLGFTEQDRVENIRRVAEVAKLMVDAGLIVIATFISPFRSDRDAARAKFEEGEFIEVFLSTPLEVCEQRDPKGLYKKVRRGEIKNFTGVDSDYEMPENPEITIPTHELAAEKAAEVLMELVLKR